MTVSTLEQLEAVPDGGEILVRHDRLGTQTWTRQEGGFVRDGTPVKVENFIGAVTSGLVTLATAPRVGQVYTNADHYYLVIRVDQAHVQLSWFRNDSYRGALTYPIADFANDLTRVVDDYPAWYPVALQMGTALLEANGRIERLQNIQAEADAQVVEADPSVRYLTDEMVTRLHRYANGGSEEFDDILTDMGIGRVVDHESSVTISGTSNYLVDFDEAQNYLGSDAFEVTDVSTATVYWQRVVRITKRGVGCQCTEISRNDLEDYLPSDYEDFDYEAECT